jgi:hypothetical protein
LISWADIPGYEGLYQISTYGTVVVLRNGKILKPFIDLNRFSRHGYYFVMLSKDGKQKKIKVCRLVAITFIPNPENKPEVNHKDGNSLNDDIFNLEWVTSSENKYHLHSARIYGGNRTWKSPFIFSHESGHTFRGSPAELKNTFCIEEDTYLLVTDDIPCSGWKVDWHATAKVKHSERVN